MNDGAAVQAAARELADLHERVEATRGLLTSLLRQVVETASRLDSSRATLLEANERLVVSALRARTDAEAAVRALSEASRMAQFDTLTQLPNRLLLLDRFAQAAANAKRHGCRMALLFVDLDKFKQINDALGHGIGDEVLKLAGRCLGASVRAADTVSRHGGDEFLILLAEVSQAADAVRVAGKVMAALGAHDHVAGHAIRLSASIGISLYPDDGVEADTLIHRADAAMYRAKRTGTGGFAFHGDADAPPQPEPEPPPAISETTAAGHEGRRGQVRKAGE